MSVVRPFKGLRVKPEFAAEIASPPYDVLNAKEARKIVQRHPESFLRVNKAELEFDDHVDPYSEPVYRRGKDNLKRLVDKGMMARDPKPAFYLYRLTMSGRSQLGLVALTSVDEYDAGLIKKHEHTRPEKVRDRANHIDYLQAQVGPVFSIFRHNAEIARLFKRITATPAPTDFVADDGIRHELWVVDDERAVREIAEPFARLPFLYIADGHHRSQSASELCRRYREKNQNFTGEEPWNFFLNVIFPDSELKILPYNRVVKDLNGLTPEQMLEKASASFKVTPKSAEATPKKPHTFGLYCGGRWYLLECRKGSFDPDNPTGSIDSAILNANFIGPILGITDVKTDKRIDFVGGIRGTGELVKLVDSGEFKLAFAVHPTSIEQLLKVADAGDVMPPKSTWFEPKLCDGLVVNLLTE